MEHVTLNEIWPMILAAASAVVLISNAAEKIVVAIKAARAPEQRQSDDIRRLQADVADIKDKLERDKARLDAADAANHVTQEALLALLEHGLNGNNVEQMTRAKSKLQNYLINH